MIALLLVDLQMGFDQTEFWGGERSTPEAEENCRTLLNFFREQSWKVFHIRHAAKAQVSPLHPSKPGFSFKPGLSPRVTESEIVKTVNSAFIGTTLETQLHELGITDLVIVGLTTDHCVSTTVRMAANLGFRVWMACDATATFSRKGSDGCVFDAELIHKIALASLHQEFAQVQPTESLIRQLKAIPITQ